MPVAHSRWILATTILASSLAFIDGSVVNVGLPAIGRSLVAGGAGLSWVINGYLLPLSALLLIGGAAGDRFGRRRVLILGVALFSLASLMCGLASTLSWLIAGRISQGIGAALLMPNSLAILGSTFSGEARGRAVGTWAAVGAAAGALAPLLGGWLIDHGGWRAIFLMNLPVAMAAIVLAARYVPHEQAKTGPSLDLAGAAYVAAGLAALTWGLTVNASIMLGVSVVLLTAFLVVERRRGQQAMLPLSLFSSRSFIDLILDGPDRRPHWPPTALVRGRRDRRHRVRPCDAHRQCRYVLEHDPAGAPRHLHRHGGCSLAPDDRRPVIGRAAAYRGGFRPQ